MRNTYLLEVIRALAPEELQEFELFLGNPFYSKGNHSQELLDLFRVITKEAPAFSSENLEKNLVYAALFPGKNIVDGKLEKLMADLNKALRKFILIRPILVDEEEGASIEWARWLRRNGLDARFQQVVGKIKASKEIDKIESLVNYRKMFELAEEEHEWALSNNRVKGDLNIPMLIERMDLYYYYYRIELHNRYLLQKKLGK